MARSTTSLYVPFEQALPWSGRWDDLPAAHGAAITFDLLALGGLLLLGRRMRPGREGAVLGVALGYAWVAYPYTTFVLESNSNDTLVAVACVGALLAATLARDRASGAVAGVALALGAAAKFVTAALAPLFARRSPVVLFGTLLLVRGARGRAVHPGRWCARAVREDDRLSGEPPVALQHLGPGGLARVAAEHREGGGRRARGAGGIPPERARPAPDRRDGRRDPDRGRADRDALVLPLHRLVRALHPGRADGGARDGAPPRRREEPEAEREAVFA